MREVLHFPWIPMATMPSIVCMQKFSVAQLFDQFFASITVFALEPPFQMINSWMENEWHRSGLVACVTEHHISCIDGHYTGRKKNETIIRCRSNIYPFGHSPALTRFR